MVLNIQLPPQEVDVNIHPAKREVRFHHEGEVFLTLQKVIRAALLEKAPQAVPFSSAPPSPGLEIPSAETSPLSSPAPSAARTVSLSPLPVLRVLGQVRNTYIVTEGPEGMYLIDQHAAHERILFERLSRQQGGGVEVQGLLQPVALELTPRQEETLKEKGELLMEYGFHFEPFGGRTYLLRKVPALLQGQDLGHRVIEVLDSLAGEEATDWRERLKASLACHAAIRAGQALTQAEMESLVRELEQTENPRTCPHGRPTMLHFSTSLLEKEFGRRE